MYWLGYFFGALTVVVCIFAFNAGRRAARKSEEQSK